VSKILNQIFSLFKFCGGFYKMLRKQNIKLGQFVTSVKTVMSRELLDPMMPTFRPTLKKVNCFLKRNASVSEILVKVFKAQHLADNFDEESDHLLINLKSGWHMVTFLRERFVRFDDETGMSNEEKKIARRAERDVIDAKPLYKSRDGEIDAKSEYPQRRFLTSIGMTFVRAFKGLKNKYPWLSSSKPQFYFVVPQEEPVDLAEVIINMPTKDLDEIKLAFLIWMDDICKRILKISEGVKELAEKMVSIDEN
jgi:hypothetical protein